MARSVDGDIQLSVGLDTSNIEQDLKKSASSIRKNWASALNVDAGKAVGDVEKKIDSVGKTVKNVANETSKSEGKFKSLFGDLGRNFSDLANGIFNAGEKGQQAFDRINKSANESESRLKSLGAKMVGVLRGMNTAGTEEIGTGDSMRGLEEAVDRVEEKEKELGQTAQATNEKIATSADNMTAKQMQAQLQLDKAVQKLEELKQKQERIASGEDLARIYEKNAEAVDKEVKKLEELKREQELLNIPIESNLYNSYSKGAEKANLEIERLTTQMERLDDIGAGGTKQYAELGHQVDMLLAKYESYTQKMKQLETEGKAYVAGPNTREYQEATWAVEEQTRKVEELKRKQEESNAAAARDQAQKYQQATQAVENQERVVDILKRKQEEVPHAAQKAARKTTLHWGNAFSKIKGLGSKMVGHIKNLFNKLKGKAKDSAADMDKSFKKGFRNILKYALGIRSFYLLFRKIRTAAKAALTAMATQFPEVNAQVSQLKNNFIQLKGSVGTMVQPLLQALAPALNTIINLFTQALTVVGSFFALLTGQKFIYKAQKGTTSFADAQDESTAATKKNTKALEENQKQLGHYDKLNIIDKNKDGSGSGGGGGGAGGAGAGEMQFVKQPIPEWVEDFMKRIKKAWKKADFSEIGEIIGTKLRDALNKINWKKIQRTAEKIGKSLGTLLAGFIKVPGLAKSIGNTIGQALNTVLIGIRSFVKNVPWYRFGKFLADGLSSALLAKDKNGTTLIGNIAKTFVSIINAAIDAFLGFVKNVKWSKIGKEIAKWIKWAIENIKFEQFMEACGHLVNGIVDLIYELVSDMETWKKLGEKIAKGINKLFTTIDWAKLGKTISDSIMGILTAIESALDTLDWESIGKAIGQFLGNIDWWGIFTKTLTVIGKAFWGVFKALITPSGNITGDIIKWVTLAIGGIFVVKKFSGLVKTIATFFTGLWTNGIGSSSVASAATAAGTTMAEGVASGVAGSSASLVTKIGGVLKSVLGKVAVVGVVVAGGLALGKAIGELIMSGVKEETEAAEYARQVAHEIGKREVEGALKSIEKLNKALQKSKDVLKNFNKSLKNAGGGVNMKKVIKEFFELSKKTKLTAVETEVLKKRTKELIKQYPELSKYVNENTGVLEINKKQMKEVVEQQKLNEKAVVAQQNAEKLYNEKKYLANAMIEAKKVMESTKATFDEHYKKLQQIGQQAGKDSEAYKKQLTITGEVANAYNQARLKVEALTEQQKKNNDAIDKCNNLMQTAKVKTNEWKEANQQLKGKLKELHASEKEVKEITKALRDAVKNGELSWKDYKEIIGKNYKSVNELKNELQKTGKVKVSPKVNVDTKGAVSSVKNLAQYLAKLKPVYNTKVKADMQYSFTVNGKKVTGPISAAQMQYLWSSGQARANAEGGIFTSSGWHDVQGYAGGGQVRSGQLFMARENGLPELVGKIKNHTAVMNNGQIVASVANGVYQAVAGVANAILPYVRSQTSAMNWLAQNGLQLPEIATGKVLPNNAQFLSTMSTTTSDAYKNGVNVDELVQSIKDLQNSKEPIIIQMPDGKVLAECVWEEEEKRYKQVRSSTVRPKFA